MTSEQTSKTGNDDSRKHLLLALVVGAVGGFSILAAFFKVGQSIPLWIILSFSGGVGLAAFFYRERSLITKCHYLERRLLDEVGAHHARIDQLYMKSMASFVEFDVNTLIIRRASIGFYDLLHFGIDMQLVGEQLESVLGLEQGGLESLTTHISQGSSGLRKAIRCRCSDGKSINLMMNAYYLEGANMVEATFFMPRSMSLVDEGKDQMAMELERIRNGMIRREERILELKGDINSLLLDSNQPKRFEVDDRTDDTRFSRKLDAGYKRTGSNE